MTAFFDGIVALIFALALNLFIVSRIRRTVPRDEAAFLVTVYSRTVALRFILAVFLNIYSGNSTFADAFWGDSFQYDNGGYLISLSWSGEILGNPYLGYVGQVSGWGFHYFVGFIYYVFGRNQLLVQFVNGTLGGLTVLVIYAIAKNLFDVPVAQWAARFMAYFPQMIFWSAALYKDQAIMLCIALCMYAVLRLTERFSSGHVALFVLSSLALMSFRFYVFYFVVFATLGTFVFSQRGRSAVGSLFAQIVLGGVFLGAFSFAASNEMLEQQMSYFNLERLQVTRLDQAKYKSGFGSTMDVSTPAGALAALPSGIVYLLFAPFPWAASGLRQILSIPETLVWYGLMPAFVRGLLFTVRHRLRAALPILVFAGALTCAYAMFQGNVGTAYRQRTQISMFFFIFMGVGLVQKQRARQRLAVPSGVPAFQR